MHTFADELQQLKNQGLYRSLRTVAPLPGGRCLVDGGEALLFCSNNYLGIADHPQLKAAASEAVAQYGCGSGAARLVSGNMPLHQALEERIARFKGSEAAILFNNGYAANTGIIAALVGRGDMVFSDRLNHASIVDGCLLSRAEFVRFPHNDMAALRMLLAKRKSNGRTLIVVDGVFSMDGDMAPLQELVALKEEFGALLMVDDAHATGVLGRGGRGTAELCGVMGQVDIQMGTFGKALGSFGAYAAASLEIIDYLRNKARSFIFSTSLPPAVLEASLAAIDLVDSPEGARLRQQLAHNTQQFTHALSASGFNIMGSTTQIVPVLVGEAAETMEFTRRLLEAGYFVQGIRPPTVPAGSCRLRCTLMAAHLPEDVAAAAGAITDIGRAMGII